MYISLYVVVNTFIGGRQPQNKLMRLRTFKKKREREAVGDKKKMCMHGALLGYQNPHWSRAVGTAGLPHRLPL